MDASTRIPNAMPWDLAGLSRAGGDSDSASHSLSAASLASFAHQSTTPTSTAAGSSGKLLRYRQGKAPRSARSQCHGVTPRGQHGPEHKRTRLNSDTAALESVDYWVKFDDDDEDGVVNASLRRPLETSTAFSHPHGPMAPNHRIELSNEENAIDDSALDNALSDNEEMLESMNLEDKLSRTETRRLPGVLPRPSTYPTPQGWDPLTPELRVGTGGNLGSNVILDEAERLKLLAIAFNSKPSTSLPQPEFSFRSDEALWNELQGLGDTPSFAPNQGGAAFGNPSMSAARFGVPSWPPIQDQPAPSSTPGISKKSRERSKMAERTAHNDIEKKYRTNIKDKIAELRSVVPSLSRPLEGKPGEGEDRRRVRQRKVSKATVLSKATEYIHLLEKNNRAIVREHQQLCRRLQAFETLITAASAQIDPSAPPDYSTGAL